MNCSEYDLDYWCRQLTKLVMSALIPGPVELGAVGVSISVFNLVSKMFNLPLLNITTSLVAEDASGITDLPSEPTSPALEGLLSAEGQFICENLLLLLCQYYVQVFVHAKA